MPDCDAGHREAQFGQTTRAVQLAAADPALLRTRAAAGYTFLDQGALNQFYEDEIKGKPISRVRPATGRGGAGGAVALLCMRNSGGATMQ